MNVKVSCIMPTGDRRAFVAQAVHYFLRQDYAERELLVVDDGSDAIADLMPPDPRIRYMRLDRKHILGTKRNLACQAARGEIIIHWDDDDWMANWRISYQVVSLLKAGADVCGLDRQFFFQPAANRAWQYVYRGLKTWVAGGTLCYTKSFWQRNPFPDIQVGEDGRFLWSDQPKKILPLRDDTFYVGLIHPGNTSPKRPRHPWWRSCSTDEIRGLLGEDWTFYTDLRPARLA